MPRYATAFVWAAMAYFTVGIVLGLAVQAAGLGLFVLGLSVFAPREPRPRDPVPPLADPAQWHALTAYGWLAVAGSSWPAAPARTPSGTPSAPGS